MFRRPRAKRRPHAAAVSRNAFSTIRLRPGLGFALLTALCACSGAQSGAQRQRSAPAVLKWAACPDVPSAQCAGLPVAVDPARPDGAKFTLRVARIPAIDQNRKKGMLVFLPGGPGAGIAMTFGDYGKAQHLAELRREYDVVTFDPRGIGQSNPIRCAPDTVPSPQPPADRAPTADEFETIANANAAFFKSCSSLTGDLFGRLAASDTAADIEQIRLALTPNDGLVAYGGSYGSETGQAYLERYGDRVKAMVLDAVLDHSVDLPTLSARNVASVNDSFERFLQWCGGDASCALHGRDAGAVYDAVAAKAPLARVVLSQLLSAGNQPDVGWPAISKMLAGAKRGDVAALESLTATASLAGTAQDPSLRAGKNGLFPGVMCADYGPQNDYASSVSAAAAVTAEAPRFIWKYWDAYPVAHASLGVLDCTGWPWPARYPPHELDVGPHPNVMVANSTHDPATPLANAVSVWLQIPQSRLLIADVDGHQSWILSSCAFHAELRFLEDPRSAQSTTLCPG